MPILNMVWWWKKWGNIWEPLNLTVTSSWLDATITWEDNEIWTIPPTSFQKSELVRKVGSAPTSPSDWDLVVTETVKDTYKVSGYTDSWLTDWTTYYYRVFSYSDLWGISYCDAVSITAAGQRTPWANTIAYWKLEWDYTDETGNYDWTGTNTTFVTDATTWFDVMECPWTWVNYMLVTTLPSTTTDQFTLHIRAKQNFTYENYRNMFWTHTSASWHGGSNNDWLRLATENGELLLTSGYGYVAEGLNITSYVTTTEMQNWWLWTFTYDRITKECKFYYNWAYKTGTTYNIQPTTWWLDAFTLGQGYNRSDSDRAFKGWISRTILEDTIRTASDITNYFNLVKWDYWIS